MQVLATVAPTSASQRTASPTTSGSTSAPYSEVEGENLESGKLLVEANEMEATLVPKEGQRDEGGEEARIMTRVHGQDPSDCGKTGGDTQGSIFCMLPEDTERLR